MQLITIGASDRILMGLDYIIPDMNLEALKYFGNYKTFKNPYYKKTLFNNSFIKFSFVKNG